MTADVAGEEKEVPCRVRFKKVSTSVDLAALSEVFAGLENPSIIGGNPSRKNAGRFSYWAAEPMEVFEFRSGQTKPFEKLQRAMNKYKLDSPFHGNDKWDTPKGMFCGGWVGYFGYELGRYIEKLPETAVDDLQLPLIRLCFYDRVIVYDHVEREFWLFVLEILQEKEATQDKFARLEELLAKARQIEISPPSPARLDDIDFTSIKCNMDREYYLRMFEKIKRYIFDGDVYQINFSQRFESKFSARPVELYHWQNFHNPSPYSAHIDAGDFAIVSASPEMFITIEDGVISTKPIKGTRRRITETCEQDLKINARNFDELVNCEKEQAELNMIIDLERNDVARICRPGTRQVVQPRTIESYPTVFHAVATVAGELREDVTFCDVMRAMFPGGSITGAPKIRSMEIIDETEPTARGVYTGSIGCIGIDGNVSLNIAIRTIIVKDGRAYAQTGGGIVADSQPQAEWDETLVKARALVAGIKATENTARPLAATQIRISKYETRNKSKLPKNRNSK
jgi:para-aminobenzoate synthetase component 1